MHFPVGFKNIDDNPFPVDKEKKRTTILWLDVPCMNKEYYEKICGFAFSHRS